MVRVECGSDDEVYRGGYCALAVLQIAQSLLFDDVLEVAGADAGLCQRGCVDIDLHGRAPVGENVLFEFGRNFQDEDEAAGIHNGIDLVGRQLDRPLELRFEDCAGDPAREFGIVFVDDADRHILHLGLCAGRLRINREGERIDDHDQQDRVGAQAVQLLDAEPEHIGKPQGHITPPACAG